jgi:serine/threonine-protein kinase SRPK3
MQRAIIRAAAKKNQYKNQQQKHEDSGSDSDASLSSEDEAEVSKDYVGNIYNSKYIVLKYLGRGTFSRVWLVYNLEDQQYYALKIIFEKYYEDASHEISINKMIGTDNKYLAKTFDIFNNEDNNKEICLATELLGICVLDLFDKFKEEDPPIELVKKITREILMGLQELHNKKIVHTDLKQENVMLDIFTNKIVKLQEYVNTLKFKETLDEFIKIELPEDYSSYDKSKKKKHKRKCKLKAYKKFKMYVSENLTKFKKENNTMEIIQIDDIDDIDDTDFEIDSEYNFTVKIIDFGNAEHLDQKEQDEIQIRAYRPPENIINDYYDLKSDIWTLGCMVFEILTGDYLFDIDRCDKSIDRDRLHIHKMYEVLGKMPREMADMCDFSEDLFDNKGRVLKHKNCNYTSISEILINEYEYETETSKEIERFLKRLLEYDPKNRASAEELLKDPWLK